MHALLHLLAFSPAPDPDLDGTAAVAAPAGLAARLDGELAALLEMSRSTLIGVALVLLIAWVLATIGPMAVRTAWRLGYDRRRRLGLLASVTRLAGLLLAFAGCLRPILSRAPTLGILLSLALLALLTLAAPAALRNLSAGLGLMTRTRMREGDLIEIGLERGPLRGTIRDIGLLRVSLRTAEGGLTHVPAADFDRLPVVVGSRRAAVPVEAHALVGPALDPAVLERLRRELWFSPFRRAGTELRVSHDSSSGRLELRIDTWAAQSPVEVEQHLRALLSRVLARSGTKHEPAALIEAASERADLPVSPLEVQP
ncbi:MAG: mechanosensitive ion channel [Myxococcales bacterium]|nr:mechanosensitive ion channel [Myxococcales bacterium]